VPYPNRYYSRKPREWGRHAKLELTLTIIVILAVIAALLIFLLVYHTLPFRSGGAPQQL
jgi:heme/copper-type cytochrome/quinol oxidase subunit 2